MVLRTEKARQKNTTHVVPRHWRTGRKDVKYSRRIGKDLKDGWKRTALYKDTQCLAFVGIFQVITFTSSK